jgi:uncharacterized protein (TIGR00299 family) protein
MPDIAFEPVMGASGDMILGALFDLGANPATVERDLRNAGLDGFHLHFTHADGPHHVRYGRCEVHVEGEEACGRWPVVGGEKPKNAAHDHHHGHNHHAPSPQATDHRPQTASHQPHRGLRDILEIIGRLQAPPRAKERAARIFTRLADAEAAVHGIAPEKVHFHEVGAVDSIVDILGACLALEQLQVDRVFCSAMKVGTGTIRCAHGILPNPAPATVRLLEGSVLPVVRLPVEMELTTPTGAAILTALAEGDWSGRPLRWTRAGSGCGSRTLPEGPNILRAFLLESAPAAATPTAAPEEAITVLETDLDDESPEVTATLPDLLRRAGALDATLAPLLMKKGRPGVRLTVLAKPADAAALAALILTHSSSIGVRTWAAARFVLPREAGTAATPWGDVRTKRVTRPDGTVEATPEFESCRELAEKAGVPLRRIMHAARAFGDG